MRFPRTLALFALLCAAFQALQGQTARDGFVVAADSVRIHYRVVGSGPDTIVVLHGGPGFSMDYLVADLMPLAARHTVVFYDQRGSGQSKTSLDSVHITLAKHISDLDVIREKLGIAQLTLLGHSWGGKLAALYAAAQPNRVARLILEDPGSSKPDPRFGRNVIAWADSTMRNRIAQLSQAANGPTGNRIETCRAFWHEFIRGYWSDPNDTLSMRKMRGDICPSPAAMSDLNGAGQLTLMSVGGRDYASDVSAVRVRALIVTGREDPMPVDNSQTWAASFPEGRLIIVEHSGHFPHVEQPNIFFAAIETFLGGSWPATAVKVERLPR
jgi:proline iminopeptidase